MALLEGLNSLSFQPQGTDGDNIGAVVDYSSGCIRTGNYVWDTGLMSWVAQNSNASDTPTYDEIDLTYTGNNINTVTYKLGGNIVSTLTLTYDISNNLTKVVRT